MSPENLENMSNFEGWGLTLFAYEKKSVCEPESRLSSNFCSLLFIFSDFSDFFGFFFLSFFLFSYCKTILKMSSVSETSSYFLLRYQWSFINDKWRYFSTLHVATCLVLVSHLMALTIRERKVVRKAKGRQIPFIDILAASKIRAKCVLFVNRLRI